MSQLSFCVMTPVDSLVVLGRNISRTLLRNRSMAFSGTSTLGTIFPLVPILRMTLYPRKSKPSVIWVILVFSSDNVSPMVPRSSLSSSFRVWASAGPCTCTLRIITTGLPGRPSQGQKGLDERALTASQRSSPPWDILPAGCVDARRLLRPPPLAAAHHHWLLTPPRAAATAARGTVGPLSKSTCDRSAPLPSRVSAAASVWRCRCRSSLRVGAMAGVRRYAASRSYSRCGRAPAAAATHPPPYTAC